MPTTQEPAGWEWVDTISDSTVTNMATVTLPLFLEPSRWIHRRVEHVSFLDRQTIRRQVSVDFTLPAGVAPVGSFEDRPVYIAPLFLLTRDHPRPWREGRKWHRWTPKRDKYPKRLPMSLFSNLTLLDEEGRRLPLTTRQQSARLANAMLQNAASEAIDGPLTEDLRAEIAAIAFGTRHDRQKTLEKLLKLPLDDADTDRASLRDAFFPELACTLATHLPIVCLFTGGAPGRSIIKIAYDEPLDEESLATRGRVWRGIGWKSEYLSVRVNEIGAAASHHIEVEIPDELQVNSVALTGKQYISANRPWGTLKIKEKKYFICQVGSASNGNVYLSELPSERRMGRVSVKMRVRRTRFLMGALVASAIITVVLAVLAKLAPEILETDNSQTSVAALLLLPSIVATYIARPGEHMISARMLRWSRFALIGNAALPFLAILCFLTTPELLLSLRPGVNLGGFMNGLFGIFEPQNSPSHGLTARWGVLAAISALFTALFVISNIWPRPHGISTYRVKEAKS